jgi:carbamoyl-phosphate synthase small subunit
MPEPAPAYLVLSDGTRFEGLRLGAPGLVVGEVVFNTSMTGYQEMLTDPSYAGQILVPTYPMIGNYGINGTDWESPRIQVRGLVVREHCDQPSHPESQLTVHEYLLRHDIPGIAGVDTRAVTRRLRSRGVMMGVITADPDIERAVQAITSRPHYGEEDVVAEVTSKGVRQWDGTEKHGEPSWPGNGDLPAERGRPTARGRTLAARPASARRPRVVVADYGVKFNILRLLAKRGCDVTVVPATASAADILALHPDGVVLSPGPGDPEILDDAVRVVSELSGKLPILGICLGHQVVGRAFGARTFKLKFGHRGGNHSVKDLATGRVYITAQNHGYSVAADGLPPELEISHVDLSDGTVEGLRHRRLPIMTIQYHSEASPGPTDNEYLFDRFVDTVDRAMAERSARGTLR